MLDGNVRALCISGDPSDDQLYEAWAGIYFEYIDLNKNNEQCYVLVLQKDISILKWTIHTVEHAVYFMSIEPQQSLVDIIVREGFEYTLLPQDPAVNANEAAVINGQLAPMKMQVRMKQKELDDYTESREKDTVDAQYFIKMLLRLSKYQGYPIRAKDISVTEYVNLIHYFLQDTIKKTEVMEDGS